MSTFIPNTATHGEQHIANGHAEPKLKTRRDAAMPEHAVRPDDRLLVIDNALDPRCEKIRALRTELLMRRGPLGRADLVTLMSPCPGEGRSLLAAELAIAFAQTGRPTLLVDADMRSPRQHALFGANNSTGLAQAIASGDAPQLRPVHGLSHLSLLMAGAVPANPLEMLSSDRFASMIEEWRRNFEFVVFDTPPARQYADALTVASVAGRVLALSRAQHTPLNDMRDMLRRLGATRSQILGTVISHF